MVAASVAGLGGLLFGYDNIVISGAIRYLSRHFGLNTVQIGWAAGCALIGCIAGSGVAGAIVDRIQHVQAVFLIRRQRTDLHEVHPGSLGELMGIHVAAIRP